jgi:hypothetical protein
MLPYSREGFPLGARGTLFYDREATLTIQRVQWLVAAVVARQHHVSAGSTVGDGLDEPGIEIWYVAGDRENRRDRALSEPRVDACQRTHPLEQIGHLPAGKKLVLVRVVVDEDHLGKDLAQVPGRCFP